MAATKRKAAFEKRDMAKDRKMGIKEMSARDMKMDAPKRRRKAKK